MNPYAEKLTDALNKKFNARKFEYSVGPKFSRITIASGSSRSAFLFVDKDGNIFKSETFKSPAKGIRFNVSTPESFEDFMHKIDEYGSALYRR